MTTGKDVATRETTMPDSQHEVYTVTPLVDIYENEDEILLYADMPGVEKEKVRINIDNGKLSLSGVRTIAASGAAAWSEFGDVEFQRTFSVPQSIDVNKVNAELKDGVLKLHLPKAETAKPRQIEIRES